MGTARRPARRLLGRLHDGARLARYWPPRLQPRPSGSFSLQPRASGSFCLQPRASGSFSLQPRPSGSFSLQPRASGFFSHVLSRHHLHRSLTRKSRDRPTRRAGWLAAFSLLGQNTGGAPLTLDPAASGSHAPRAPWPAAPAVPHPEVRDAHPGTRLTVVGSVRPNGCVPSPSPSVVRPQATA